MPQPLLNDLASCSGRRPAAGDRARQRVAVVGSGISGLAAARALAGDCELTLFEAQPRAGGHSHTVDIRLEGVRHGVDTGFLVFNHRTYPRLVELFDTLGVPTAASDMSFSVQLRETGLEWSGCNLNSVFAQRSNLLRPAFLGMLTQIVRFNRQARALARRADDEALRESVGEFLDRHAFGEPFRHAYLLPMLGCIWSCPTDQMLRFPVATMLRFCDNHGLLQVTDRPQWMTVQGGSRHYVDKMMAGLDDVRRGCAVRSLRRSARGVLLATDHGSEVFDDVVLACHSDESLALLSDADADERDVLGAIRYQPNRAVLHTDASLLPRRRRAWAAWNYEGAAPRREGPGQVCLHYLINRLQPLPWKTPVVVSLNPRRAPAEQQVLGRFDYAHPVFDAAAIDAQQRLGTIQGRGGVWFCGAWTRYGFHEDGLMSGQAVAAALREHRLNTGPAQRRAA